MRSLRPIPGPTTLHRTARKTFRPMVGMFILLIGLFMIGCNQNSPVQPGSSDNVLNDNTVALTDGVAITDGTLGADSSKAIFSVDFGAPPKPGSVDNGSGNARAIAFDATSGKRRGIDIGTVTLTAGSQNLTLQKITERRLGVAYSLLGKPGTESGTGVSYVPGATYQFSASGATGFSAMNISITAPAARLAVSNLTEGQVVSKSSDLTVNWNGGDGARGVVLRIMPAPPKPDSSHRGGEQGGGRGPGGMGPGGMGPGGMGPGGMGQHGQGGPGMGGPGGPGMDGPGHDGPGDHKMDSTHVVVVKLDAYTGTYTVSAAKLQAIVAGLPNSDVVVSVAQLIDATATHDGSQVRIVFHDDAHVKVKVQ